MLLESVAAKHEIAKEKLNGFSYKERRKEVWNLDMLSEEEIDAVLRAQESTSSVKMGGMKLRVDTNQVSSNEPNEDYIIWRPIKPNTEGGTSQYMFGVFDGHNGSHRCAEQVAARIGPMLDNSLEIINQMSKSATVNKTTFDKHSLPATLSRLKQEECAGWGNIPLALTAAFLSLDRELVYDALSKYCRLQDVTKMDELLRPALDGSCGLVAVVDAEANEIVVANIGDSRALLGTRLNNGTWKAVPLSEDQTGTNKKEVILLNSEHPNEPSLIVNGRVLGGPMITRAFGDCMYKWPLEVQKDMFPSMYLRGYKYAKTPPNYLTPPYITANPEIVRHKLDENDKFIVVASDGLYDQLSDAEVVNTVARWYEANQKRSETLMTQDMNVATHLIRLALSIDESNQYSDTAIGKLLAIPSPHSRRFRDDISAMVILLDRDQQ
ncbi:[Pyruvate dehydrogenase [acetyl-transferring]]-phosphatase 1, mitochondrial [Coemansia spiralis]|uniref:[Pyruvate dehydrogenase [acetyl-transferring]]-phosphatase 1, mitochondrial n=2 Tax=Coemansia TaxID=4863 RepID=A0A9W8G410_9FUNG|nr:[Pyruvate dehydrogenase [acetyl-transferring]]-phosphatase 1, mitochondrial [Coemansia umbellata]KAJ2621386.1 [Pyruvate dehydrogenase [acetyl-transferring]]-phosphatase 1, mitochondrial [Coemansia sp. RSA 1358]KAJ2673448.1 [Pyruvate dehydrogenase [acetyl-transferring]]-phosphatase 1, mitochondrial [Coemansia spiralis]